MVRTARDVTAYLIVLAVGLSAVSLIGCSKDSPPPAAAAPKVINATCPIMGGSVNQQDLPPELVREYKGQKIGFCCAGCPPKWDQLTAEKKDELLAKIKPGG